MYKIVQIQEDKLQDFKEKIVQVIDSCKREVIVGYNYLGCSITDNMWILTCLVEVKDE